MLTQANNKYNTQRIWRYDTTFIAQHFCYLISQAELIKISITMSQTYLKAEFTEDRKKEWKFEVKERK